MLIKKSLYGLLYLLQRRDGGNCYDYNYTYYEGMKNEKNKVDLESLSLKMCSSDLHPIQWQIIAAFSGRPFGEHTVVFKSVHKNVFILF